MKKKYLLFLIIFFLGILSLKAQKIDFSVDEKNKPYVFAIYNGLKMDTIAKGMTSDTGKGQFVIPAKYKNVAVMGMFSLNNQKGVNIIINKEEFSFSFSPSSGLSFNNSLENALIYGKDGAVEQNKETYAYAYMRTRSVILQMADAINQKQRGAADLFKVSMARSSALNDIDIDKLYYSNFWYFAIDGLLKLSIDEENFANSMIRLLAKVKNESVYLAFVEDLITITTQFGMDDAFDQIISDVEASERIKYPQGNIYDAFIMSKMKRGAIAPAIEGLSPGLGKTEDKYTLLFFYEPGCDNCQDQIGLLKKKYDFFKERKVRVVTLSGSLDKDSFKKEKKDFLWKDSLCDFKGFSGGVFQQYGIVATPMLYLLDENGVVLKRFTLISEVEMLIRGRG